MLAKIAVGFLAAFLGFFSACAVVFLQTGVGSVSVNNEHVRLWLPLPMAVAEIGLWCIPKEERQHIRKELAPVKDLVLAGFEELRNCPDLTLVEVKTPDESVLVVKEGNDLVIDVDSRSDGKVQVELPIHSLQRILRSLAG